jgi:hypothetical protein
MPSTNLQKVPDGAIVACPVSGCELRYVAGVGVLMVIKYIEKSEQLETGDRTTLQALLVPEQALEIGEALKRSVQALEIGKALKRSVMMLQAPSPEVEPAMSIPISA